MFAKCRYSINVHMLRRVKMLGNEKCHRQLIWTILLKGNGSTSGHLTRRRQMVDEENDQCGLYTSGSGLVNGRAYILGKAQLEFNYAWQEMARNGTHAPVTQSSSLCEAS
ncbi:hypothetical protein T11_13616 [Trichinella zimbabwensis]|uniref:Uncharacterized protein n=2 Tax=Trichinella TaxID=6333 RepID=A0A0V1MXY3_9BILA|nr:hypothetical protein T11_13616 [Trichinella zimbabwensis]KRZ76630.1 hypothetical protein T10_7048 [Trichinella papuae]